MGKILRFADDVRSHQYRLKLYEYERQCIHLECDYKFLVHPMMDTVAGGDDLKLLVKPIVINEVSLN